MPSKKDNSNWRSRTFLSILYPDSISDAYAIEYIQSHFQYAMILHDKDVWSEKDEAKNSEHKAGQPKKAHYHFVIRFPSARWVNSVSNELLLEPRRFEPCRSYEGSLDYLLHANNPEKAPYSLDDVSGPLKKDFNRPSVCSEDDAMLEIISLLDSLTCYVSLTTLLQLICEKGLYSSARKSQLFLLKLLDAHNAMYLPPVSPSTDRVPVPSQGFNPDFHFGDGVQNTLISDGANPAIHRFGDGFHFEE